MKKKEDLIKKIEDVVRFHCRYCGRLKGQDDYHPTYKCEHDVWEQVEAISQLLKEREKEMLEEIEKLKGGKQRLKKDLALKLLNAKDVISKAVIHQDIYEDAIDEVLSKLK